MRTCSIFNLAATAIMLVALLVSCSAPKRISDTLIGYEAAGHSREDVKDAYTMRDLVCALDNRFWELDPGFRSAWIAKHYPDEIPEDFIDLPESGAQCALTVLRLDKDLVTVVSNSQNADGYSSIHVLRRIPAGWTELTDRAFPYRVPSNARFEAHRDKSITLHQAAATGRYVWRGSRFVAT